MVGSKRVGCSNNCLTHENKNLTEGATMKKSRLLGGVFAFVAAVVSTAPCASIITYNFTGTVIDPGVIAGVSASLGDMIVGEFSYESSTLDSNPGDSTEGWYFNPGIIPPLKVTLPSGSIAFDSSTSVFVTVDTELGIAAGAPDPTVSGNNLDHDITFSLKPTSTALATDALPTSIDLSDYDSAIGAFSSFSLANGPAGDPIFYAINTLSGPGSGGPTVFLPTVDSVGVFNFNMSVLANQFVIIDPIVATGYTYNVGAGDPNFAALRLPSLGDDIFSLSYVDSITGQNVFLTLLAGELFLFPTGGVDGFVVTGIETALGLDPGDVTAFMAEVAFTSDGTFTGNMTPITQLVSDQSVPTPAPLVLMTGALVPLIFRKRLQRKKPTA